MKRLLLFMVALFVVSFTATVSTPDSQQRWLDNHYQMQDANDTFLPEPNKPPPLDPNKPPSNLNNPPLPDFMKPPHPLLPR